MKRNSLLFAAALSLIVVVRCGAQGTAFTYQGRLGSNGVPVNGTYDVLFTIHASATGTNDAFANVTNAATVVSNGLFTATIDFGAGIFTGPDRWLKIEVRTNGGNTYTALSPRQKITATPYAITAGNVSGSVSASQLSGSIAPANIGAGTITSTMLAAGSVTTSNIADGAVNLAKLNTTPVWTPSTVLTNPTPGASDNFGTVMAAFGTDKVIITAPSDHPGPLTVGAAYLIHTNGSLIMTFTNPTPADLDFFGAAVDAVGLDKVLIGAHQKDIGTATNAGAAYLFSTNGTLLMTFTNPTPEMDDEFGSSVAAVGTNKVLIGAAYDSTGTTNAGSAYLFNLNGTLLTTFTNPAPGVHDIFGYQVISVGDKVVISAPLDDSFGTDAGAAYLYSTNGTLLRTFTPLPGESVFGIRMAPVGSDRFLITAGSSDNINTVVYLFSTNGTRLTTFGPASGIGISLAWISPDRVALGATYGSGSASLVYLFNTNGTPLGTFSNPTQIFTDQFAYSMAAVGNRLVVGSPVNDTGSPGSGVAYLFGIGAQYIPGLVGDVSFAPSLGNVTVTSGNIVDGTIAEVDLADGAVSDAKISSVDASKLTGIVNATTLGGVGPNGFWQTIGNAGTTPGVNFLGTTDNQPLTLQVNNTVALQIRPGATLPNVVGGLAAFRPSVIANGVSGAVIAGGNAPSDGVNGFGGGDFHAVYDNDGVVGGGFGNKVGTDDGDVTDAAFATVAGGVFNGASGYAATVAGGDGNSSTGARSAIGGGYGNIASGTFATVSGGFANLVNGDYGITAGGANNVAGTSAFAAGTQAKANHQGSFVWADSQAADFSSSANNEFSIRASGGVRLNTDTSLFFGSQTRQMLNLFGTSYGIGVQTATTYFRSGAHFSWFAGGVHNDGQNNPGGGTELMRLEASGKLSVRSVVVTNIALTSDRDAKENFTPMDTRSVLEKVTALSVSGWNFKGDSATRHIGPMAQDFYAAFQVGEDDKHIAVVDEGGVALAAIQGLNQKLEQKLEQKETEIAELKQRLEKLERLINNGNGRAK